LITTPAELNAAQTRWVNAGGDLTLFTDAANALDSAICQADVSNALGHDPAFRITVVSTSHPAYERDIFANGQFMMRYTLTEQATDADVAVHP